MNAIQKRFAALLLAGVSLSTATGALAYDEQKAADQADALKTLGLFQGSDQGFELERAPSRMDALIMLLRMTGQETEARFFEGKSPFVDAPTWDFAAAYLAYAFDKGLTTGVDATHFDPTAPASAQDYVTFMLRALGHTSTEVYAQWETLANQVGLLPKGVDTKNFRRGDVVMISYAALDCQMKDGSGTLQEKLQEDAVFGAFARACALLETGAVVSVDSTLPLIMASVYSGLTEQLVPNRMQATVVTKENMKSFLGTDTLNIEEGYAVEPAMSSLAHSVVLVRLMEGEDVEAAKKEIAEKVDPRKWICVGVEPENVRVESIGNLVCLMMDNGHADALQKNFKALPLDAKGAVLVGDTVVEKRTMDEKSLQSFAAKLSELQKTHMKDNKVYFSIIPDKSNYLAEDFAQGLSYEAMMKLLRPLMPAEMTEIDFSKELDVADYYRTDLHWRQEALEGVVAATAKEMGFAVDWQKLSETKAGDFIGTYSRLLDSLAPENFSYMKSSFTDKTEVTLYGQEKAAPVYDTGKLESKEPYGVFLSELSPLTILKNPEAKETRRLVIFGDSFATSYAPLLLEAYSEITLVDLRFMASSLIAEHVDFQDAEVLFLYSSAIVNNSTLLK